MLLIYFAKITLVTRIEYLKHLFTLELEVFELF